MENKTKYVKSMLAIGVLGVAATLFTAYMGVESEINSSRRNSALEHKLVEAHVDIENLEQALQSSDKRRAAAENAAREGEVPFTSYMLEVITDGTIGLTLSLAAGINKNHEQLTNEESRKLASELGCKPLPDEGKFAVKMTYANNWADRCFYSFGGIKEISGAKHRLLNIMAPTETANAYVKAHRRR